MKRIIGARKNIDIAEIGECTIRLELLCDNLFILRLGLRNEECIPRKDITDNALCVIEDEIRNLAQKIDNLLYEREEV